MYADSGPYPQPPEPDSSGNPHPSRWCYGICKRGWVCWEKWESGERSGEDNLVEKHRGAAKTLDFNLVSLSHSQR